MGYITATNIQGYQNGTLILGTTHMPTPQTLKSCNPRRQVFEDEGIQKLCVEAQL